MPVLDSYEKDCTTAGTLVSVSELDVSTAACAVTVKTMSAGASDGTGPGAAEGRRAPAGAPTGAMCIARS